MMTWLSCDEKQQKLVWNKTVFKFDDDKKLHLKTKINKLKKNTIIATEVKKKKMALRDIKK